MTENQMDEIKRHFNVVAEGLQHEIRLIAEGHDGLRREIQDTRHDLNEKLDLNTALIKTVHDSLDNKIDAVRDELKTDIDAVRDELKTDIGAVRDELKTDIGAVRDELKTDIGAVRDELKTDIGAVRDELKTDIAAVGDKVDGHQSRIQQLERRAA